MKLFIELKYPNRRDPEFQEVVVPKDHAIDLTGDVMRDIMLGRKLFVAVKTGQKEMTYYPVSRALSFVMKEN